MRKTLTATLSLALVAAACGEDSDRGPLGGTDVEASRQGLGQPTTKPAGTDLSTPTEATIYFHPDWSMAVAGTLYEGGEATIVAAPDRFPTCGVAGSVSAFAMGDSGEIVEVPLDETRSGWPAGGFQVPADTTGLELWLRSEDGDCVEYDSDYSRNHHFAVHAWRPTLLRFKADFTHHLDGSLEAGAVLVIDYDPARLPECRGTYRDIPMWDIVAFVAYDNGIVQSRTVLDWETEYGVRREAHRGLAVFPIPADAGSAEVWFKNDHNVPYPTEASCPAWDSDFGRNYHFGW